MDKKIALSLYNRHKERAITLNKRFQEEFLRLGSAMKGIKREPANIRKFEKGYLSNLVLNIEELARSIDRELTSANRYAKDANKSILRWEGIKREIERRRDVEYRNDFICTFIKD